MTTVPPSVASATETAEAVRSGRLTARAAVERSLARIAAVDGDLNAFTVVRAEEALAEADALDAGGPGHDGPLAGVPVAVKEEYDVTGLPTTLGGYGNTTPVAQDSELVRRLRAAGAVVVGKTTMPEFGQFPICESLRYGVTRNPWDLTRSPGGSSGGSAVAVAAGCVPIGMAADGGGSVRIPAGACGVVGLKPTRGRLSPAPLPHHWYSLVTLGAITRTATDSALVLDVVRGNAVGDTYRLPDPDVPYAACVASDPTPLRVLRPTNPVLPGTRVSAEVAEALASIAGRLSGLGHEVRTERVRWPSSVTPSFLPQFYAGMRHEAALVEHPERLEPRTRATARRGAWATEAVVRRALRLGEHARTGVENLFADADLLLLPVTPGPPGAAEEFSRLGTTRATLAATPLVSFVALLNVTGHPGLSLPAGRTRQGWPVGAQLVAPWGREDRLLAVAAQLERQAPWPVAEQWT